VKRLFFCALLLCSVALPLAALASPIAQPLGASATLTLDPDPPHTGTAHARLELSYTNAMTDVKGDAAVSVRTVAVARAAAFSDPAVYAPGTLAPYLLKDIVARSPGILEMPPFVSFFVAVASHEIDAILVISPRSSLLVSPARRRARELE